MEKVYTAKEIAKHILYFCNKKGVCVSNSVLQKMLYILQCYCYNEYGYALFEDNIFVDDHEIIVDNVYSLYSSYGDNDISYLEEGSDIVDECDKKSLEDFIDEILRYSEHDLDEIVFTDIPVIEAQQKENHVITKESIRQFYAW